MNFNNTKLFNCFHISFESFYYGFVNSIFLKVKQYYYINKIWIFRSSFFVFQLYLIYHLLELEGQEYL